MNDKNQYRQNSKVRGSEYGNAYSAPMYPEFHAKTNPTAKSQVFFRDGSIIMGRSFSSFA